MDFQTTHSAPVKISINGTAYDVPRFLLPQFEAWAASRQKAATDAALAKLGEDAEAQARFMLYWQPAPIDVAALIDEGNTPQGVRYILDDRLKAAGVPDDVRGAVLTVGDPARLAMLSRILMSGSIAAESLRQASNDPGERGNPTTGQSPTSGGSPMTTETTSPPSPQGSPESTQAA